MMAQALDAFSAHFIADCKIAGLLRVHVGTLSDAGLLPYSPSSMIYHNTWDAYMNVCSFSAL